MARTYYRGAAAALLVFDVTNRQSFENLNSWVDEARLSGNPAMDIIVVGNKTDLPRVVSYEEAKEFATSMTMQYVEASARTGINVEKAFELSSMLVLKRIETGSLDP